MKHLRLFENIENPEDLIFGQIQSMIDNNQFLKGKVEANKETVYEAGDFILLLGDLTHITDAHVEETIPGSKFNKGVDLKKAIIDLVSNNEVTEMTKGFGPNEVKVNNTDEAEKFKWLGLDSKTDVGIENVHQSEPNSEEFKSMNVYTYKDSRGNEFNIKVKQDEGEKTSFLSFIGAKLGKIGNKVVLSVMTAFPGKNGVSIANRNEFINNGLYFTTTSKEVIEMSRGSITESKTLRYLKTFESFKVFESEENKFVVTQETTVEELESYLDEQIESRYSYGSGDTLEGIINSLVYQTLVACGKSEEEAENISDEFVRNNMEYDTTSIPDEFDMYERRTEGENKYKYKVIFEFSCGGDGYAYIGSFNDLTELLDDIKSIINE